MEDANTYPMRINKYLAHQGLASRRQADELIAAGRVFINGKRAEMGAKVTESDQVEVKGSQPTYHYFLYNKPVGIATEDIKAPGNTLPLGRLDKESRGLLLLTNDRRITGRLLDPEFGHEREYAVTVDKHLSPSFAKIAKLGVEIEGYKTKPAKVSIIGDNIFKIVLTEGKKHQIRRMCAALGFQVIDLERTRIMHLRLGNLKPGSHRELRPEERTKLLSALGL